MEMRTQHRWYTIKELKGMLFIIKVLKGVLFILKTTAKKFEKFVCIHQYKIC